jgi:carbon-monoxide dehydrogenase small subunit
MLPAAFDYVRPSNLTETVQILAQRGDEGKLLAADTTSCGVRTVLLDGVPIKSCTALAVQADGREIRTVEGLEQNGTLHPIQAAFMEEHGLQCGFCTPGMMMASVALLESHPNPSEEEIRWALSGNLCRCTGYMNIVKSVRRASENIREENAVPVGDGEGR